MLGTLEILLVTVLVVSQDVDFPVQHFLPVLVQPLQILLLCLGHLFLHLKLSSYFLQPNLVHFILQILSYLRHLLELL